MMQVMIVKKSRKDNSFKTIKSIDELLDMCNGLELVIHDCRKLNTSYDITIRNNTNTLHYL